MDAATFAQLPGIHSRVKCPACGHDHILTLLIALLASRYSGVSTFVAKIGRIVGGLLSKDQRFDRNEAKRRQKESAATLHRFKTQDVDRARAAAALIVAASTRAEARALAMRLEQEEKEEPSSPEINNSI